VPVKEKKINITGVVYCARGSMPVLGITFHHSLNGSYNHIYLMLKLVSGVPLEKPWWFSYMAVGAEDG
jgi:hypothetical protein